MPELSNEQKIRLMEELPCAAALLKPGAEVLIGNRLFWQLTLQREHERGRRDREVLHQRLEAQSLSALRHQLATHDRFSTLLELHKADGTVAWLECTAARRESNSGHLCLLHDVTAGKLAELRARAQAAQLHLLADSVPAAIAYYEAEGITCLFANRLYARMTGQDERAIVGKKLIDVIGTEATALIQPSVDRVVQHGESVNYIRPATWPNGEQHWLDVSLIPQLDEQGKTLAAFVLILDITKHIQAEQTIRESEARLQMFMDASAEGIVFHQGGRIVDVNPVICEMVGYSLEELVGSEVLQHVAPAFRPIVAANNAAGRSARYFASVLHKDGSEIPVEFIGRTFMYQNKPMRMSIVRDMRDRKAAEQRINYLAHHDELTGLINRGHFVSLLESALEGRGERKAALLFVDLDHFKRINDSLGHRAGDELLAEAARRIRACCRDSDVVARFAGDEFIVLLQPVRDRQEVTGVVRRLLDRLAEPFRHRSHEMTVTASAGIAMYPEDAQAPDELIAHADAAVYSAKRQGRASFEFYSKALSDAAYEALVLEQQLLDAVRGGEFVMLYQPQWHASSNALVGFEALIRWNHPERGLVVPNEFIPLAEERRLMNLIGEWVMRDVAATIQRWRKAGLACVPVAVNLSSQQFESRDFLPGMQRLLAQQALPPELLELELTERMLMDDVDKVAHTLTALRAMGVRVTVDDFGTGFSSLGHLKHFAIDKLKIDRSFVRDLPAARDSAAITTAIVQMAHSLGISVIAEGVETEAQRDFLVAVECDQLQGYLLGKPLSTEQAADLLKRRDAVPAA
jgi:diguanylate cyclase (GGDEF)-like protein/PAS domain S-box-containing protein